MAGASAELLHHLEVSSRTFLISDATLPDNPIVYVSPSFCRLTGYSERECIGRNCRFLQGPGTDPRTRGFMRSALIAGRECSCILLNFSKQGRPFWNYLYISPLLDVGGKVRNFVGV